MKSFRNVLFWIHLIAGLITGLVIGVMSFTGAVLAFEDQIEAWAERDARRVEVLSETSALPLAELQAKFSEAFPDVNANAVVISKDPANAVVFQAGRREAYYANPYTGEIRQPESTWVADFMSANLRWHRWLAQEGDNRPIGKAITGASNLAFILLAVTGLYLWWPSAWRWPVLRRSLAFIRSNTGKARDWNWHNAIGFWALIPIVVMAVTGTVFSYRWAGNLIYTATGEEVPQQRGRQTMDLSDVTVERPQRRARPATPDQLLASVQAAAPQWEKITLNLSAGGGRQRGGGGGGHGHGGGGHGHGHQHGDANSDSADAAETQQNQRGNRGGHGGHGGGGGHGHSHAGNAEMNTGERGQRGGGGEGEDSGMRRGRRGGGAPQALTATVQLPERWPRTAETTFALNPFTAEVLKTEGFADRTASAQVRGWVRYLHTGEALGWPGQLIAWLGCLGGCFLVYTGFALSWRRFFRRPKTGVTSG